MNQIGLDLFQLVDPCCIKLAVEFLFIMVMQSCSLSRRQMHLRDTAVWMPLLWASCSCAWHSWLCCEWQLDMLKRDFQQCQQWEAQVRHWDLVRAAESLGGPGMMNPEMKGKSWGEYTHVYIYILQFPEWKTNLLFLDSLMCQSY